MRNEANILCSVGKKKKTETGNIQQMAKYFTACFFFHLDYVQKINFMKKMLKGKKTIKKLSGKRMLVYGVKSGHLRLMNWKIH